MKILLKVLKVSGLVILGVIIFCGLYLLTEKLFSSITIKGEPVTMDNTISLYLLSNGVHTDLVVPVKNEIMDWTEKFPYANTKGADSTFHWIALGWGDKGFYLETPTWAELKPSVAFKAAFGLSTSAIHATFYQKMELGERCRPLQVTKDQYTQFLRYVESSLELDTRSQPIHIPTNAVYGDHDAFYEANGSYSLLHTCNTWTNRALKELRQNACLWTAFDTGILNKHPLTP